MSHGITLGKVRATGARFGSRHGRLEHPHRLE